MRAIAVVSALSRAWPRAISSARTSSSALVALLVVATPVPETRSKRKVAVAPIPAVRLRTVVRNMMNLLALRRHLRKPHQGQSAAACQPYAEEPAGVSPRGLEAT